MLNRHVFAVTTFAAVICSAHMWAQANTGTIQGKVFDPTHAVIANASLTLERVGNGQRLTATTAPDGKYRFAALAAGEYELKAQAAGFNSAVRRARLTSGQTLTLDITLQVGSMTETVDVSTSHRLGRQRRYAKAPPPPYPPASVLPASTDDHGIAKETGFAVARNRPLSTFSIDVDTAAYSILRRSLLQQGQLPPKEAVRIEELLNYFDYDYPAPEGKHPFSVVTELAACPWNKDHQLVHIGLKSNPVAAKDLPPANLTFLIDVSGSMMPENRLPLIKKSFRLLVDQLREQDRVAVVVYAGAAGLVLEPTPGSQKQRILDAIDRLQAGGSTAGAQGIQLAYETARRQFNKHGNNRVILATDGDFNVGMSSDAELVKLIEAERESGIFLTVLGYGYGNLKDAKLESLARNGNGNYAYVDSILEARRVFVEQMGATLLTVAKDVKLQVEFNPAKIKAYRLIGYENRRLNDEDFKDDKKDAGEMGAGHSVTALYEVVPADSKERIPDVDPLKYQDNEPRVASASQEALTVKLRYKAPKGSKSIEFAQALDYRVSDSPSANFRMAMAVTELGLLLSDSKFKGKADFANVLVNAQAAVGEDRSGKRAEFVYLAKTAEKLASVQARR